MGGRQLEFLEDAKVHGGSAFQRRGPKQNVVLDFTEELRLCAVVFPRRQDVLDKWWVALFSEHPEEEM